MTNQDQPAYPFFTNDSELHLGLTKRELFAAMAMQGLLTNPYDGKNGYEKIARSATVQADSLLAELDKDVVCEWKWHKDCNTHHKTGCGKHIAGLEAFLKAFPFCPYCGKRIKEVA